MAVYQQDSKSQEFEKNPELKEEDLDELREWVTTQKHLPTISDDMLILFHHSCYYKTSETKDCIEAYYTLRANAPEIFSNRDIFSPELAFTLKVLNVAVLSEPDPNGNRIIYMSLRDNNPANYIYVDQIKLLHMTLNAFFLTHGTVPGIVMVYDMQGYTLSHVPRHNYTILKKSSHYLQTGCPVRLKAIHVTNVYWWVHKAFAIVRPLLNPAIKDMMYFHKSNSTLYEYVPKECLPQESGGTMASIDVYHAKNTTILEQYRDFFKEDDKNTVDEMKREKM